MIAILILAALLFSSPLNGQQPRAFDPFPNGLAAAYHFDLEKNFFPSPKAAAVAREDLVARAGRLRDMAKRPVTSGRTLFALLAAQDTLDLLAGAQYAYLSLRGAIDTRDAAAQNEMGALAGALSPAGRDVARIFGDLSSAQFDVFTAAEPRLAKYQYAAALARSAREHELEPTSEELRSLQSLAMTWGPQLFQSTLSSIDWGTVSANGQTLDVRRNGNEIRNHPDRSVRERGYSLGQAGIASRLNVFASILTRTATARNTLSQKRRWPDYPAEAYAAGGLDTKTVRSLLQSVAARAGINKRYEQKRIDEIRREFGYDSVHVWDLTAPSKGAPAPRFTISEATTRIIDAAAPLGPGYVRELRTLLNPASGRLDLVARPNRVDRPGFSTGSVGYPSMFFQGQFEGYVEDVVILAHEAGHAVQNMLMDSAKVLPRYSGGPSYFTESFALLSELLFLERQTGSASSADARHFFARRLLEDGLDLFRNGLESLVEQEIYDSTAAERTLDATALEALMQKRGESFSVWFGPTSERQFAWVQPLQLYTRPLYRVNYVIGKLLALRYLELYHESPAEFTRRYGALLRNGYDAPPQELLRRFLGVDMSDADALVASATKVLERWVAEYDVR